MPCSDFEGKEMPGQAGGQEGAGHASGDEDQEKTGYQLPFQGCVHWDKNSF